MRCRQRTFREFVLLLVIVLISTALVGCDRNKWPGCDDTSSGPGAATDTETGTATDPGSTSDPAADPVDGTNDDTPRVCEVPITLADVSNPDRVVGNGTGGSCTEAALRNAVTQGGIITFDCGPSPVTIALTETLVLPLHVDTVVDGGGRVTLDAGRRVRHFYFHSPNFMATNTLVTLQRLVLINGRAPAGQYFPQDPANPECAYGYKDGSGGALFMRDGRLHVIDCNFYDNEAALEGPDIGGGALYMVGASEVIIANCRFEGNRAASGGAVGMLFANPRIYNSVFENNTAEGIGMNYVEPGCPNFNHDEQGGAGGNAGAMYFDGMNDDGEAYTICGSVFRNNRANELGGALFRTPNRAIRDMVIDRCVFEGNTARAGGVSFIKQCDLTVRDTLFTGNRANVDVNGRSVRGWAGGLWINESALELENSTFYDNAPNGLSAELYGGANAVVRSATFVDSALSSQVTAYNSVFVNVSCGTSQGGDNLQFPQSGTCPNDTTYADPQLASLADNGGPTQTMMPAANSPALDQGADCPAADQRGEPRPNDGCDLGAVER